MSFNKCLGEAPPRLIYLYNSILHQVSYISAGVPVRWPCCLQTVLVSLKYQKYSTSAKYRQYDEEFIVQF